MEPDQPIEKLLKAAASKRRGQAGVPFRLHPADRRLLQGEVSRTFAADQKKSAGSAFAESPGGRFWPKFGWTFGVITGVVAAALLMWPAPRGSDIQLAYLKDSAGANHGSKSELAKAEARNQLMANRAAPASPATETQNKPGVTSTLSDAAAPAAVFADRGGTAPTSIAKDFENSRRVGEQAKTRSAEMPVLAGSAQGPVGSADSLDRNYRLKKDLATTSQTVSGAAQVAAKSQTSGFAASSNLALAQSSSRAIGTEVDRLGLDKKFSDQSAAAADAKEKLPQPNSFHFYSTSGFGPPVAERQRFMQKSPVAGLGGGKSAEISTVLRTFEIQHTGDQVKIVDEDGSIYSGGLLPRSELQSVPALARRKPSSKAVESEAVERNISPAAANAQSAPVAYSFRASGTNRTLNENVTLNGDIIFPGITNAGSLDGPVGAGGGSNSPVPFPALNTSKVSGDARVGERAFKFDAEPIK